MREQYLPIWCYSDAVPAAWQSGAETVSVRQARPRQISLSNQSCQSHAQFKPESEMCVGKHPQMLDVLAKYTRPSATSGRR